MHLHFRDNENKLDEIKIHLDIDKLMSKLDDDYILGLRLHPHVANKVNLDKNSLDHIIIEL